MDALLHLPVTAVGLLVATAAVIVGGPLFAAGLAAVRCRRAAHSLEAAPLGAMLAGPVLVHGRIQLESPLFAPLSQRACAGFVLEVAAPGAPIGGRIEERRAFRLIGDGVEAHVAAEEAAWAPEVTAEREVAADEVLPSRLEQLIESVPEARWLRARGSMRIVERALLPSAQVWVAGVVRRARPAESAVERVLAATGTDDATAFLIEASGQQEPELWIEAGDAMPIRVFGRSPDLRAMAPPSWQVVLVVLGPVLSLLGLIHIAQALDRSIGGRF